MFTFLAIPMVLNHLVPVCVLLVSIITVLNVQGDRKNAYIQGLLIVELYLDVAV